MAEPPKTATATGLVDHFFRHQYGRLVAKLCGRFGPRYLESIEDAVQGALEQALGTWSRRGLPENPEAWLTRTAQNRLIDHLRRAQRLSPTSQQHLANLEFIDPAATPPAFKKEIADDELRMLFVCADDGLKEQTRLVLCLKLLSGFSTREISDRLFLNEASVQKTVERGRNRLRELQDKSAHRLKIPESMSLARRLSSVQQVIYLQFTEGYASHHEDAPIRRELCHEALRLAQLLVSHPVGDTSSSWALLALIHFQTARLNSRIDEGGELLLLREQDRTLWDRQHLRAGFACFMRSADGKEFSRYHGEAAILAEHCRAASFEKTNWSEIVELYELLEALRPSPLYTLNKAIALSQWKGPEESLTVLLAMTPPAWLTRYYLWDATLGELYRRAHHFKHAIEHLNRAIEAAPTQTVKRVFQRRLTQAMARNGNEST